MKKCCNKVLDAFQQFDLFAPGIALRYRDDNDYKTYSGAFLSVALICLFGVVFVRSFIDLINIKDISSSASWVDEQDPGLISTTTPDFMFAVGLNSINMNVGLRYFNLNVNSFKVINGKKFAVPLKMVQCRPQMWKNLGESYNQTFQKLNFQQWKCPEVNQSVQLQGKHSSQIFKYIRISLSTCNGSDNGQGCHTPQQVQDFNDQNEYFGFSYYFLNTLINYDDINPVANFLDDLSHFTFNLNLGISCNFYLESFKISIDESITPFPKPKQINGFLAEVAPAIFSTYTPKKGEYFRYYIRKSPTEQLVTQSYYKIDELLSYIGGLFGLIILFIQIPMQYYNSVCFELSLATDLFTYKNPKPKKQLDQSTSNIEAQSTFKRMESKSNEIMNTEGDLNKTTDIKKQPEDQLHSVDNFNFMTYLLFVPFYLLKKIGWKSLNNQKLTPYYQAIKQVRRQIDLGKMIERFIYFDRSSKTLFDADQRKLLHVFPKQNIFYFQEQRKQQKKLRRTMSIVQTPSPTKKTNQQAGPAFGLEELSPQIGDLRTAYMNLLNRNDKISRRIIQNLDQNIKHRFSIGMSSMNLVGRMVTSTYQGENGLTQQHEIPGCERNQQPSLIALMRSSVPKLKGRNQSRVRVANNFIIKPDSNDDKKKQEEDCEHHKQYMPVNFIDLRLNEDGKTKPNEENRNL